MLDEILGAPGSGGRRGRLALLVVGLALAAAVGDTLRLPFPYVPPSARLLPAIVAGALLGPGWGAGSQGLVAGATLAAAVAGAAGAAAGSTGVGALDAWRLALPADLGYRLGLPACAFVVGRLAGPRFKATPGRLLAAGCLGLAALDAVGLALLAWLLPPRLPAPLAPGGLLRVGVIFPLPWDLAQVALAAWVVPLVRRRVPWVAFPEKPS